MESNRGMGFQLAKTLALGPGLKGGLKGLYCFTSGQLRMEWRSKNHGVSPGILHYKDSIGGNPRMGKLSRALWLTRKMELFLEV